MRRRMRHPYILTVMHIREARENERYSSSKADEECTWVERKAEGECDKARSQLGVHKFPSTSREQSNPSPYCPHTHIRRERIHR